MKNYLLKLLVLALVLALAAFVLAPAALRQIRLWGNARLADAYDQASEALSLLECGTLLAQARDYDAARGGADWSDPYGTDSTANGDDYAALLDPLGNGMMCVLEIPKLGDELPVYHGGGDLVARVAHVPGSSLPVGATGGQCALCALPDGRRYDPFAGLDRLIPGDCFTLRTLRDTMVYEVVSAAWAQADALGATPVEGDGDECLLIAPGNGSRRLVVRGRRASRRAVEPSEYSRLLPNWASGAVFAIPMAIVGLVLLALLEKLVHAIRRRRLIKMKL